MELSTTRTLFPCFVERPQYQPARRLFMRRFGFVSAIAIALFTPALQAQQAGAEGPYKVLKSAKVGGEGGTDYIYADVDGRRLYITRNTVRAVPATETAPARDAIPGRVSVFNLETLALIGEVPGIAGNGATVDSKSGHGFTSNHPDVSMFDTKTLQPLKNIKADSGFAPDGRSEEHTSELQSLRHLVCRLL